MVACDPIGNGRLLGFGVRGDELGRFTRLETSPHSSKECSSERSEAAKKYGIIRSAAPLTFTNRPTAIGGAFFEPKLSSGNDATVLQWWKND